MTIDKDLWTDLRRALGEVPMSMTAHQSVQRLLEHVERESMARAMRAKAEATGKVNSDAG